MNNMMNFLKCFFVLLLTSFGMSIAAKDYKYVSVNGDMMHTRIYTLDNGLKIYMSVNNEKPRVQTYIAVKTGSRNDPATTTGLAHYLEHLMFKGSKQFGTTDFTKESPLLDEIQNLYEYYRTLTDEQQRKACYKQIDSLSQIAAQYFIPNEYDKLMSSIGAEGTNAYTSNDVTCYVEDIPSNEMENWAKIQADRFQNMVIRGFHTELEAVYEEYNISLASDEEKEWNAMTKLLFPNHPYGTQTTIGTQEHLKNPSIVNIKNYFNKYYRPNNVAICLAGDFNPDVTIEIIDKYFGMWQPGDDVVAPVYAPVEDLTQHKDTTVVGQEAENIYLAWKFNGAADMQNDTLQIVSSMLSNGKAGLLDLNLDQKMKYLGGGAMSIDMAEYSMFLMVGYPKEGQSLEDVKTLLLGEIDKLKAGDFDDNLLKSVVNNKKLQYYMSLESNSGRAEKFVDAFINGRSWADEVAKIDRLSRMTKQQIINFAREHFKDNYVAVYKRIGTDSTQKKIEKPAITPIPVNRDMQSSFVTNIINSEVQPILPKFVDFDKDILKSKTKTGLPLFYVKNNENGRFVLNYVYDFGTTADNRYPFAAEYITYLGTDKMSAEQLKRKFYELACSFVIKVTDRNIKVSVAGLDENMPEALKLTEYFLNNMKVDNDAYENYVQLIDKSRKDDKLEQRKNFTALRTYAIFGEYNPVLNKPSVKQLEEMNPQTLVDMISNLKNFKNSILYYGPTDMQQVASIVGNTHVTAKTFLPLPQSRQYQRQQVTTNEVFVAPYDAKNIYMSQYNSGGRKWNATKLPTIELFNEYFGGGMNSVVFQELRETRGLAYSAGAYYVTPSFLDEEEYAQTFIISQNDKMNDCINTFSDILNNMPYSDKAFALAKQALKKRIATSRKTKMDILNAYMSAKRLGLNYDIDEKIYNDIDNLTIEDIASFEKEVMADKNYRYAILGNEKELDMQALEKIGTVKRLTTEEIFGY